MNSRRDRGKEKKHSSRCTPRKNWVCGVGGKETDWKGEKKKKKKGKWTNACYSPEFPPLFSLEGTQDRKEKKNLICLQTRNGVHAEIAGGFGLESAATAAVCTATFAPFILCLLNKWIFFFLKWFFLCGSLFFSQLLFVCLHLGACFASCQHRKINK